jgi:Transposase IS66 family
VDYFGSEFFRAALGADENEILKKSHVYCAETTVQVLNESGKTATSKSYMWAISAGEFDIDAYCFEYHKSREAIFAPMLLSDCKGVDKKASVRKMAMQNATGPILDAALSPTATDAAARTRVVSLLPNLVFVFLLARDFAARQADDTLTH